MERVREPDLRCAGCGAGLAAGAPWCSLCYRRTAGEPRPAADPPAPAPAGAGWPCEQCGRLSAFDQARCRACGTAFLATVAGTGRRFVVPLAGDLTALTRAGRIGWACGYAVVAAVALVALLTALGLVL